MSTPNDSLYQELEKQRTKYINKLQLEENNLPASLLKLPENPQRGSECQNLTLILREQIKQAQSAGNNIDHSYIDALIIIILCYYHSCIKFSLDNGLTIGSTNSIVQDFTRLLNLTGELNQFTTNAEVLNLINEVKGLPISMMDFVKSSEKLRNSKITLKVRIGMFVAIVIIAIILGLMLQS